MYQTVTRPIFNQPTAIAVAALPQPQQLHATPDLTACLQSAVSCFYSLGSAAWS